MDRALNTPRLRPVILAGGVGARLAPISTPDRPKPFVPLADGQSLLSHTLRRVADAEQFLPTILVGRMADRYALLNHARAAGVTPAAILLEPQPRNTAMAMAVAAAYIASTTKAAEPPETLVFLPADHWLEPVALWQETLRAAATASDCTDKLCLLGVNPTGFNPNYGVMATKMPPDGQNWREITQFIEKPAVDLPVSTQYWWNSGQFIGSSRLFCDAFATHAPALWAAAQAAIATATPEYEFLHLPETAYTDIPAMPFDRAVVEKAACIALPLQAAWQDLGTLVDWQQFTGRDAEHYARLPARTDRPWGYFETLAQSAARVEKRLTLYPGTRISEQRHWQRSEYWEVLEGSASVECDGIRSTLGVGESVTIVAGAWHRLSNVGTELLIIKEIQMGKPDEADIERSADDYGRS